MVLEEQDQTQEDNSAPSSGAGTASKISYGSWRSTSGSVDWEFLNQNRRSGDTKNDRKGIEFDPNYDEESGTIRTDESHLIEPILNASRVLKGNPRRIAQLVNLTRFQRLVAEAYVLEGISDEVLAKWTAVCLQWPQFVVQLEDDEDLRNYLRGLGENEPPKSADSWRRQISFLQREGDNGDSPSSSIMHGDALDHLMFLSLTVPVAETQSYSDPDADIYSATKSGVAKQRERT